MASDHSDASHATDAQRIEALLEVLEVSRQLGATTDLNVLLEAIEQSSKHVLGCERATVFVHDAVSDDLYSRVATGVPEIRFPSKLGIAGRAFHHGEVINVSDAYADERFNPEIDKVTGFRTRNILTCPLSGVNNARVGVLQVLNKHSGQFSDWDVELAKTLSAQAGVALQRQLLLEEYAVKQRILRDLNIARDIQQGLLPQSAPEVPGFDVAGWNKPADETGGDFFDFQTLPDGKVAVTIADVTGHGIGPALVVAACRAMDRAIMLISKDLGDAVRQINHLLCEDLPDDRFITACFSFLDAKAGTLEFKSAGHGPLLYYEHAARSIRELSAHGIPLGILKTFDYAPATVLEFQPGDLMLMVTDGFDEWSNPSGVHFGSKRLGQVIIDNAHLPSAEIIQQLHSAVLEHSQGTPQLDDLTAVVIRRCQS